MSVTTDLDLTGLTEDDLERGGSVEAGWYRTIVTDAFEDAKNPGTIVLKFAVVGGPFDKYEIVERLFHPDNSEDAEKAKVAGRRMALFAKRLGLLGTADFGQAVRLDWSNALGREVALKVIKRKYKDKNGNDRDGVNVDFAGIYQLTDERVPAEMRQGGGGGSVAASSSAPPGANGATGHDGARAAGPTNPTAAAHAAAAAPAGGDRVHTPRATVPDYSDL